MKQLSLAETGFLPKRGKVTRKAEFLAEMNTVVPWSRLEGLIEPVYPRAGRGRRPTPDLRPPTPDPRPPTPDPRPPTPDPLVGDADSLYAALVWLLGPGDGRSAA